MSAPWQTWITEDGNIWVSPGRVVAYHSSTVTFSTQGRSILATPLPPGNAAVMATSSGSGQTLVGGSGRNVKLTQDGGFSNTAVPEGRFTPLGPNQWATGVFGNSTMTYDPGDGHSELDDGIDIVAQTASGGTLAPYGTFESTPYGEATYNDGNPFSLTAEFEGDPAGQPAMLTFDDGTAQAGRYNWTGWQEWTSDDAPAWVYTINGAGLGELTDGTDIVATRPADPARLYDPSGPLLSTPYGAAAYGSGTVDAIAGSPSAGTLESQTFAMAGTIGAVERWPGQSVSTQVIELDTATGDALLFDGVDAVAARLAGSTGSIDGAYASLPYGEQAYNGGSPFIFTVATTAVPIGFGGSAINAPKPPMAGFAYVVLEIDPLTNEVIGLSEPDFAAVMPANSDSAVSVPIAYSDGFGGIEQIQIGAIPWRP